MQERAYSAFMLFYDLINTAPLPSPQPPPATAPMQPMHLSSPGHTSTPLGHTFSPPGHSLGPQPPLTHSGPAPQLPTAEGRRVSEGGDVPMTSAGQCAEDVVLFLFQAEWQIEPL